MPTLCSLASSSSRSSRSPARRTRRRCPASGCANASPRHARSRGQSRSALAALPLTSCWVRQRAALPRAPTSYKVSSSAADMGGLLAKAGQPDSRSEGLRRRVDGSVPAHADIGRVLQQCGAAGDARVQAVAGVPPPEVPAPTKVTPSPHTVRAPAPRLDAQRFPGEKASVDAWMAQFQRTREIGRLLQQRGRGWRCPRTGARSDGRLGSTAVVRAMPANAARAPARARSPQLTRSALHAAPQKPTHEFYLQQGLAGAAKKAKQEAELEAFRKSFQKNHFPSH